MDGFDRAMTRLAQVFGKTWTQRSVVLVVEYARMHARVLIQRLLHGITSSVDRDWSPVPSNHALSLADRYLQNDADNVAVSDWSFLWSTEPMTEDRMCLSMTTTTGRRTVFSSPFGSLRISHPSSFSLKQLLAIQFSAVTYWYDVDDSLGDGWFITEKDDGVTHRRGCNRFGVAWRRPAAGHSIFDLVGRTGDGPKCVVVHWAFDPAYGMDPQIRATLRRKWSQWNFSGLSQTGTFQRNLTEAFTDCHFEIVWRDQDVFVAQEHRLHITGSDAPIWWVESRLVIE